MQRHLLQKTIIYLPCKLSHYSQLTRISFLWKTYKETLRLPFKNLINLIFSKENIENINISEHLDILEKIIFKNFNNENKKIVVFIVSDPKQNIVYSKNRQFNSFKFFEVKLNKNHRFIIDEHPNIYGHKFISEQIYNFLIN